MIHSGRPIFAPLRDGVFELLGRFDKGLIVDVGAAAGYFSMLALQYSPGSRALCFEPFPGNWPHWEKALAGKNARLIKKAVAEKSGEVEFHVAGTAKAEGAWKDFEGYSSAGFIVEDRGKLDRRLINTVPVTTIDENVSERILIMKIDVQGGELNVLRGSVQSLKHGVDLLQIEFGGKEDVLGFVMERGYLIFDNEYLLMSSQKEPDLSRWDVTRTVTLSTGKPAYTAWPKTLPPDPADFCNMFREEAARIKGHVYTDLVAVAPHVRSLVG